MRLNELAKVATEAAELLSNIADELTLDQIDAMWHMARVEFDEIQRTKQRPRVGFAAIGGT